MSYRASPPAQYKTTYLCSQEGQYNKEAKSGFKCWPDHLVSVGIWANNLILRHLSFIFYKTKLTKQYLFHRVIGECLAPSHHSINSTILKISLAADFTLYF